MSTLRFRQIHLDFHTSEQIPGIGSEFVAAEFVDTLQRAHVDSVTLFSRCHHGLIYHDTRFPAKHPHLTCNLLAEQLEACHKADIQAPIYITVGLDEYMAAEHPEWIEVDANGNRCGAGPLAAGWRKMDFASPYLDYVVEQTEEVLDLFGDEVDGLFFDIINVRGVHSKWCMKLFSEHNKRPDSPEDQAWLRRYLIDYYRRRVTDAVRAKNKTCRIFHNSGHIYPSWRDTLDTYSHLEIESLPSGGWGYAHFPVCMRYARNLGLDTLAMTGRFAKTWGHFSSFKPAAALEYECMHALALGAKVSVGDQLHPRGKLDEATYQLIGEAYAQVEAKEAWCDEVEPLTEIAVFNVEAVGAEDGRVDTSANGAYRILAEGRHQFDYVDQEHDWGKYKVMVFPDKIPFDRTINHKVANFLTGGGKILASHLSGLNAEGDAFVTHTWPAVKVGELPFHPDFLLPLGDMAAGLLPTEYVMYERGLQVTAAEDAEVLGQIWNPYFNRSFEHFCSHNHTPVDGPSPDPGILASWNVVYFAHPVFASFAKHGMVFYKYLVLNALKRLLPNPLVKSDAPSTLHVTWNRQPAKNRSVVHLLHYIPERRTQGADYLEDIIPLHDVTLQLRTSKPSKVYLAPSGEKLKAKVDGEYITVTVPRVEGHAMLVLDD